jgi:hypothetical protein
MSLCGEKKKTNITNYSGLLLKYPQLSVLSLEIFLEIETVVKTQIWFPESGSESGVFFCFHEPKQKNKT